MARASTTKKATDPTASGERRPKRAISGNLYYNATPGALHSVLSAIIKAEKPKKVDQSFIATVLSVKGGSGKNQIPALKRLGFLDAGGLPTDLYSRFRSETKRSQAALEALKQGYAAIFAKNSYAHKLSQAELEDLIVEITGLTKEDPVTRLIGSCFEKVRSFITSAIDDGAQDRHTIEEEMEASPQKRGGLVFSNPGQIGLNYVINIVLPSSSNIETYNLIFRSLRDNILDWTN